jgi:penicillin G amidase
VRHQRAQFNELPADEHNELVPRWLRRLTWVAGVLVVILLTGFLTIVWTIHRSYPETGGRLSIDGLTQDVKVLRDVRGIPQIYASTAEDLFFAQGYVQAQDRFFEMDFRRHVTAGTLTELFGEDALKTDKFIRTMGWRRVAEREVSLLKPQTRAYLQSYSKGVNAYLSDHTGARLSLEYAILGLKGPDYSPARWTPVDSLAWLKAMAWDLSSNVGDEIERAVDSTVLSRQQIGELFPPYPYAEHPPIVSQGGVVNGVFEQDATGSTARPPSRPGFYPRGVVRELRQLGRTVNEIPAMLGKGGGLGSNAWAVSGTWTKTGKPILANDPHLGPSMPGIWYQMGLHCVTISKACPFDVAGFTFSGFPGVIIGHNDRIAWGFTNLETDTADLYLEKVTDNTYLYGGKHLPLTKWTESFAVVGKDKPVTITKRATRHGPIMSDVSTWFARAGRDAPTRAPGSTEYAVALRWAALTPGNTADAVFELNRASDWEGFRDAARDFRTPSQNLVYADVDGNIGYQAPGQIPIRPTVNGNGGNGEWPVPGWNPRYEWTGYIPFDALPNVLNPDNGVVATANQPVIGPGYPYFISSSADYGYRSTRIRHLLEKSGKLDVAAMNRIQNDTFNEIGRLLTPYLLRVKLPSGYFRAIQNAVASWDYTQPADSRGALAFNVVWRNLLVKTFHDQIPKAVWPDGGDRWFEVMRHLIRDPRSDWWDDVTTPLVRETRDDVLRAALMNARRELTRTLSLHPRDWQWGKVHTLTLENPTLGAEGSPVAFAFNRGPFRAPGGPSIVLANSWVTTDSYQVTAVPSMRMVVLLADLDKSTWVNLTGASGHAYNKHYDDQTNRWLEGKTWPWPFSDKAVQAATEHTLTLTPG